VVHLGEQDSGPLSPEIAAERDEAADNPAGPKVHHSDRWRHLITEGSFGSRQNEVHRQPSFGDPVRQIQGHTFGATGGE
jgi:hypothetical protein